MPYCANCGEKVLESSSYCHKCGERIVPVSIAQQKAEQRPLISDEEFKAFITRNHYKYISKFQKFSKDGTDKLATTWHWPAFFVGFWWALYRKLYLWAIIRLILSFIPLVNFFFWIIFGMTANYIYYKKAKKSILRAKDYYRDSSFLMQKIKRLGGVNGWIAPIAVAFTVIVYGGIISAIAIPQFATYQIRSYNTTAVADMRNAATAQEAYYVDESTYCSTLVNLIGPTYGLYTTARVNMTIVHGSDQSYRMISFHASGNHSYLLVGPGGSVSELHYHRR